MYMIYNLQSSVEVAEVSCSSLATRGAVEFLSTKLVRCFYYNVFTDITCVSKEKLFEILNKWIDIKRGYYNLIYLPEWTQIFNVI